ncbi:hypothetical protein VIBHAR_05373 [Vibrio campbellii ATCC BAA-1116]|uniref:Transposase TnpC homeodomain domain-containing protein n=1 Tax=Vibrio campbellii (strain ATCC BAA-1116) TaxID=2902295 RepID=A7N7I9_VIBC1|nr:hypothetical protein VIBHAR_05373 [Vibrio campbellii ATCC BAA-1116]
MIFSIINAMKKTPNINPESQDVAKLQAMVKALLLSQERKESQWKQERQSLLEQLKLAFDRQFAKRSEALKPYDESQGDLFNEVECEAAKEEEVKWSRRPLQRRSVVNASPFQRLCLVRLSNSI